MALHLNIHMLEKCYRPHIGIAVLNFKHHGKNYMSRELSVTSLFIKIALALPLLLVSAHHTLATDKPVNIVVFGDSLSAGLGLAPDEAFPEQLQKALILRGQNVVVQNAGVSGDTTSSGLARLDWSIPDGTHVAILELGANDALRGISPSLTRDNLAAMIARLKQRGINILLTGMLAPPNMGEDFEAQFNGIYRQLASAENIALYPFFLDGVAGRPMLNQADGMHPSAKGVNEIVKRFLPVMENFLKSIAHNQ